MAAEATVHIVDDDAAVRRTLERVLDTMGFQTRSYESSSAFLDVAPSLSAGCILLDVRMPGMDGLELQARLLQLGIALPVIVVTAKDLTEEDRLFLNGSLLLSGCVKRVMQKGNFSLDELAHKVRDLVVQA